MFHCVPEPVAHSVNAREREREGGHITWSPSYRFSMKIFLDEWVRVLGEPGTTATTTAVVVGSSAQVVGDKLFM